MIHIAKEELKATIRLALLECENADIIVAKLMNNIKRLHISDVIYLRNLIDSE